jgi:hypothetical protein
MTMIFVCCITYFNSFGAQLLFMEPHSSKNCCSVGIIYLIVCLFVCLFVIMTHSMFS